MKATSERRRWQRGIKQEPGLGVIHAMGCSNARLKIRSAEERPIFAGILNEAEGGVLIEADLPMEPGDCLLLSQFDNATSTWHSRPYRFIWRKMVQDACHIGLEAHAPTADSGDGWPQAEALDATLDEVRFLLQTKLLRSIPTQSVWSLLNCLAPSRHPAGSTIIRQGDPGDSLYLIQEGECQVVVEKGGEEFTIARLNRGDVCGEMAVLTREPRYASVVARTDIKLWRMDKDEFETVTTACTDLRIFLTELVSQRLESSSHTSNRTVGKYMIKHMLGHGAWSIVYQGAHTSLNKTVAIKMLKHTMAMDNDFLKRFKQEATIIAMLNHRNIVHVYDIEELYRTMFIVMEHLDGESLEDLLARQGCIPYGRAVHFLVQICAGLSYAHGHAIVHQDIKPANLQVLPDDTIKILDFGLACDIGSENFDMEGTAFYMAPEQIDSEPVDERTDIYCLGVTAYEMIVGQRPYPEEDIAALLNLHVNEDIPDPALVRPDIPPELRHFILTACRRDPAQRFLTMAEALEVLQPCHQRLTGEKSRSAARSRLTSVFFFHDDKHIGPMNALLEEMSGRAQELGLEMRAAEFKDL